MTEKTTKLRHGIHTQGSDCPECGLGVRVDEDGCYGSCGKDAMYYGTEYLEHQVRSLRAKIKRLQNTPVGRSMAEEIAVQESIRRAAVDQLKFAGDEIKSLTAENQHLVTRVMRLRELLDRGAGLLGIAAWSEPIGRWRAEVTKLLGGT
jgi:hypothetical protein